jgi:hypothetical protein
MADLPRNVHFIHYLGLVYAFYTLPLRLSSTFNKITSGTFAVRAEISQSVQRWAKGWTFEELVFDSLQEIFLFSSSSGPALGPTQPPIR